MKWKIIIPIVLALVFFGVSALNDTEVEVSEIMDIALDEDGDVFILERTTPEPLLGLINMPIEWRVMKVDQNGKILLEYLFPEDAGGRFQAHSRLEISTDGGVYVHSAEYNASNYYLTKESVDYLSSDFSQYSVVMAFDYIKEGQSVEYEKVLSMNELEGTLYVYKASNDAHESALVYAYDPVANKSTEIYEIILQDERNIDELVMIESRKYLFRTMTGEVFITEGDDTPTKIFPISSIALPDKLKYNEEVGVYYYDAIRDQIIQMDPETLIIRFNPLYYDIKKDIRGDAGVSGMSMNESGDIAVYTQNDVNTGVQVLVNLKGNNIYINQFIKGWDEVRTLALKRSLYGFALGLVLVIFIESYKRITAKRKPVLYKFSVVFIPLMLIMSFVLWRQSDEMFGQMAEDDLFAELHHLASLQANQIDVDLLKTIDSPMDYGSSEYVALEEETIIDLSHFNTLRTSAYERWVYGLLYRKIGDRLYVAVSDIKTMSPAEYIYNDEVYALYEEVLDKNHVVVGEQSTVQGDWLVALAPILDADGEIVGILEIGTGKETYAQYLREQNRRLLMVNLGSVLVILVVLILFIMKLLKPLQTLTDSVSRVAQGEWGTVIHVTSNDEIGVLTKLFNQMSVSIAEYIDNMQKLNEKYFKFVPQKFFDLLGKENILQVELGDQIQQSMAIVYMNLRDFFKTSAEMSPEESLSYINEAYRIFGKSITDGQGTIGAFRDSGQVGIFESLDKALIAAISATEQIRKENGSNGTNMNSGICVHEGSILIGVVGEENRMSTAVMSDQVNHAVTLEAFADATDIGLVLSQPAYNNLMNPDSFEMRFLGHVKLKGQEDPVGIYDVYESDPQSIRQLKQVSKNHFEQGVHAFEANNINEARKAFIRVLRTNRYDSAAHMYLMKCEEILENDIEIEDLVLMDLSQEAR